MQIFVEVLDQMLFLFACIIIGCILRKMNIIPEESASIISKIENTICIPALILSVTLGVNDIKMLTGNLPTILYSMVVVAISCVLGIVIAPKLTDNPNHIGIFRYSIAFSNFGFMGQSVIQGVFGNEMLYAYCIFQLPAAIALYSIGTAWLTNKKGKFSFKMFLNPTYIAMAFGMIAGLAGLKMPSFISKTISGFSSCYSPLAMLLTGIVIAKYDLKKLFKVKNVYYVTLIRLILIPLAFFGLCSLLGVSKDIIILILTYTAMPLGLYTIIIPAATGGDDMPGASMAVISNIVGIITVPLIFALVS